MAATDQMYRKQSRLDIVFSVSCIAFLVSVIIMFCQDFYREYKVEQREFRNVEEVMARRAMLRELPSDAELSDIANLEAQAEKMRRGLEQEKTKNEAKVNAALAEKIRSEVEYQNIKAMYDSVVSLRDIAVDQKAGNVQALIDEVKQLGDRLTKAKNLFDVKTDEYTKALGKQPEMEKQLAGVEDQIKELRGRFERFKKLASDKQWGWGDAIRALPVIDGFASPYKIQQYTLDSYPIDYNFKQVTRYDRCTTCHQGIDRASYTKESLKEMAKAPDDLKKRLDGAKAYIKRKGDRKDKSGLELSDLPYDVGTLVLSEARVNEFCAHPRLDLFVDGNSPHPAEKFGCTSCHQGQGSSTSFVLAAHTPDNSKTEEDWRNNHGYEHSHYWDFPMLPKRFQESACIKCHHQVTDLIRDGVRNEAPKVVRGYNLVRENGCFGCHEISGLKAGRWVGPDLRLEPEIPLENLSPQERAKALADPLNPPGTLRKVGPSLKRIAEKTSAQWTAEWIKEPRGFRPDTRMPHFYNLSTNAPGVLPASQKDFPDQEIQAIAHYLFTRSGEYLQLIRDSHADAPAKVREEDKTYAESEAIRRALVDKKNASEDERKELKEAERKLEEIRRRRAAREAGHVVAEALKQLPAAPKDAKERQAKEERGRSIFAEKGCLACHSHDAMNKDVGKPGEANFLPELAGDANFGPNLSRLAAKLGDKEGDEKAQKWLVQWIVNPAIHSPRTLMPVTHLSIEEADAIATWLLSHKVTDWERPKLDAPNLTTLQNLAKVHLKKVFSAREIKEIFEGEGLKPDRLARPDADEIELTKGDGPLDESRLMMYIGRKAIGNSGCFGCHSIPGFENTKPIGTPLNEWGKKDPERLAFENASAFVKKNYHPALLRSDPKDPSKPAAQWQVRDGKAPYEQFFSDALDHHMRVGFLHQKLVEPRSFDYDRDRTWDDRLRMPQFRFSRKVGTGEPQTTQAKIEFEEAEAREAVMTFILGLVAEPVPNNYLNHPPPDRLAEVKGKQVLDKYNCAACHLVRPGIYQFNPQDKDGDKLLRKELDRVFKNYRDARVKDLPFANDNAWVGQTPARADQLTAHGVGTTRTNDEGVTSLILRLTRALRYHYKPDADDLDEAGLEEDKQEQDRDLPAGLNLVLPPGKVTAHAPAGGVFSDALSRYLLRRYADLYKDDMDKARSASVPALLREGEKAQPAWLFQFLKNPQPIRPLVKLRMPKFSLSDEEAAALVNYFAAVDKVSNLPAGLNYPYQSIPQRDDAYWAKRTAWYWSQMPQADNEARLKSVQGYWEDIYKELVSDAKIALQAAEMDLKDAKDAQAKADAAKRVEDRKKDLAALDNPEGKKRFAAGLDKRYIEQDAYAADGYRLIANNNLCLKCHQVGNLQPAEQQGPPLMMARDRLRPEWTHHWLSNPIRLSHYNPVMPQNFLGDSAGFIDIFAGPPELMKGERELAELEKKIQALREAEKTEFNSEKKKELVADRRKAENQKDALNAKLMPYRRPFAIQQTQAVTDVLLYLAEVQQMPANRNYRPGATPPPGGK